MDGAKFAPTIRRVDVAPRITGLSAGDASPSLAPRTLAGMAKRVIAHLDCDAFFASVELQRRPELRGLPVIVAGTGPRAVVTTASYEARKFGIGSAMSAAEAKRRCPQAVTIPPDHAAYSEKSREVWGMVRERIAILQQAG